jgi:hypothetical protein
MGAESTVTVRFKGKSAAGKARLETEVLHFRGGDLTLSIPFKQMSKVTARGGALTVAFPGGTASFDLGVDDAAFLKELEGAIAHLSVGRAGKDCDAIFFGVTREAELSWLEKLKTSLKPNGALWIVRPKGRPEISERATMAAGKAAGLVDVKVVGFSATHTAEKFVIPVSARRP